MSKRVASEKNRYDNNSLWAITSYFNPAGYRRRFYNYHVFREHLKAALVTVELARGGSDFELQPGDADVLVQLRSDHVLWQKERLLNIALKHVPPHVRYVAWLDCDVLFGNEDWVTDACRVLDEVPITQLYSHIIDLEPDITAPFPANHSATPTSTSKAYRIAHHPGESTSLAKRIVPRDGVGFAWAARRELLDRHGLYDAFVLGSGDRAIACAAWGRLNDAVDYAYLNSHQEQHYLTWAEPFSKDVRGQVGYVPGCIYHLWHGRLELRRHQQRHADFASLSFNPFMDLRIDSAGCWAINERRSDIKEFMSAYFRGRNEDDRADADRS